MTAGQGAGPSRRSHTKSRKGCKTCKRRHIRCDESFPQCRNCTKHQVRCDYLESLGSDTESIASPDRQSLSFSPGTESSIEHWQQTGRFPYPELGVFPLPHINALSKNELRLIHHLSTISNDLISRGTSNLTLWTQKMPKFLSIASSYPYVMQALLSFSANHLAWTTSSTELRNLHIQHGTSALSELHRAIGSFSHENADAVLAASLLLLWQATDWLVQICYSLRAILTSHRRSWSSLRAGIQSVLSVMQSSERDSIFAEYINDEDLPGVPYRVQRRSSSLDPADRQASLQSLAQALHRLQNFMLGNEVESQWVQQLLTYIQRLQVSAPAQTPEDQFGHLYALRKWLFWVPILLLQKQGGQGPAMLALAHFYATALALEPLFPDLGSSFCAKIALGPLEAIISMTNAMQSEPGMSHATSMEIATLMQFPRQTAMNFRARHAANPAYGMAQDSVLLSIDPETLSYTSIGNLSPAFAPSPLSYTTEQTSASSSFLEVPVSQAGFTYGTQSWGAMPSPNFPPQVYTTQEELLHGYGDFPSLGAFRGGFVTSAPVWT